MIDDKTRQLYEDKAKQMTEEYLRNGVESNNHLKFIPVFFEDANNSNNIFVTFKIVSESEVELYEIDMEDEPELLAKIKKELESEERSDTV